MILFRKELRRLAALYAYVLLYSGTVLMTFVSMRYRLPVMIGVLPFAGAALERLFEALGEWKRSGFQKWMRPFAAAVLGSVLIVHLPIAQAVQQEDLAHTYYLLGNVASDDKRYEDALKNFEKAVELYPDWHIPYNNLGLAYIRVGKPALAVQTLQRAVDLDAGTARVYRNLGKAYEALEQKDEAVAAYEKATAQGQKTARNWLLLGRALEKAGRYAEAKGRYTQGLARVTSAKGKAALKRALRDLEKKTANKAPSQNEEKEPAPRRSD